MIRHFSTMIGARSAAAVLALVLSVGCDRPASVTEPRAPAPHIDLDAVLKPLFHTTNGSFSAGTAYLARIDDDVFVVSASHLFSPAGGLPESIPNPALPTFVEGATFAPMSTRVSVAPESEFERFVESGPPLKTKDVKKVSAHGSEHVDNDVIVFPVARALASKALPIRTTPPAVGDPVWLAASLPRGKDKRTQLFAGRIIDAKELAAVFPTVDVFAGASGAPVLDADGRVVGHLARGAENAELYAATSLLQAIRRKPTD